MSALNFDIGLANLGCGLVAILLVAPLLSRSRPARLIHSLQQFWGEKFAIWSAALLIVGGLALFIPMADRPALAMALALAPVLLVVPFLEAIRLGRLIDRSRIGS